MPVKLITSDNLEARQHNLEHSLQEWNDLRQQMAAVENQTKKNAKRTQ
jgi:flagellar motility protein MotE (MotC chaperone)